MSTIANTISVAKVTSVLSSADIAKGQLFPTVIRTEPRFPLMITTERIIIQKIFAADPNYTNLQIASDYLYDLCGKYKNRAQAIVDGGGGGSVASSTPSVSFPLYITSGYFTTSTFYPNTNIFGNNIIIFMNEINRYLIPGSEFTVDENGITITLSGFDSTSNDYNLVIEKYTN